MATKKSFKSFWRALSLRCSLFRIWFMKNIMVWVRIAVITLLAFTFTGNITADTPILGKIFYPIFKPLVDEIVEIINEKEISGLMDFFAVSISVLLSLGTFTIKCRRIAQSDIKSDKLKIALIKANLYFNEDGKLVKKVERLTDTDIDGDGIIDTEGSPQLTKGLISGIFSAIKEFFIIATTDLSSDTDAKYEETLEKADLKKASAALKELDNTTVNGLSNLANDELDKKAEEISNSDITEQEKTIKLSFIQKLKNKVAAMKNKKEVKKETKAETIEVVENNVEKHSAEPKKPLFSRKKDKIEGAVAEPTTPTIVRPAQMSAKEKFLKELAKK